MAGGPDGYVYSIHFYLSAQDKVFPVAHRFVVAAVVGLVRWNLVQELKREPSCDGNGENSTTEK